MTYLYLRHLRISQFQKYIDIILILHEYFLKRIKKENKFFNTTMHGNEFIMDTISIAMATYNGERYIREQLDSILVQTISFDEVIIYDDVSTDGTWAILTEYAAKDARIKIFRNSVNVGVFKNFEFAASACSGEYIAFCDQDDIWLPEHLEVLRQNIGDKMLVVGDAEIIDSFGRRSGKTLSYLEDVDWVADDDLQKAYTIFFYRGCYQGASMMIKKELLSKAMPIPIHNYHDLWLSCLACFYGGIRRIDTVITLYRRHEAAVTGGRRRKTRIRSMVGHLLLKRALRYRPAVVKALQERLADSLTCEQQAFLKQADQYYKRRKTLLGRIANLFFELKYFKLIYACK